MVTVSFPGLGINEFTMNPVAFTIPIFGGIEIRWYGIVVLVGIILAFLYCTYRAKQEKISFDNVLDIAIFTLIFSVIGARTYYVLTSLKEFDSFYDVIAIWEGGLAIYGAIIAGAITVFVVCRMKKISYLKMFDALAPGVMIGQIIGRWGNFFNGEAYGTVIPEKSPLYFIRMGLLPNMESTTRMYYFHPTFLYESLWNLIGFLIIHALYKKKKFDGQIFLMYIAWYGFGRMLIEELRTDSLYVGVFRISQIVGLLCFVIGTLLLILKLFQVRRAKLTAMSYEPTYAKISGYRNEADTADAEKEDTEESEKMQGEEEIDTEQNDTPPKDDAPENSAYDRLFEHNTDNENDSEDDR